MMVFNKFKKKKNERLTFIVWEKYVEGNVDHHRPKR